MPEGDTIFRAARTLHRALAGQVVTRFETGLAQLASVDDQSSIRGRTVEKVEAVGKHCLMTFSGDLILRTHLRMNGSWHVYRPGERWQRPRSAMRVVVETAPFLAVGFDLPVAEFRTAHQLARDPVIAQLGPDLLSETFDADEALRRLAARSDEEVAVALLNQRVLAGAGNVYKSEVCFLCGVNPFLPVRAVAAPVRAALVETARTLLLANIADPTGDAPITYTGMRRTTHSADPSQRLWVYGRAGEPCRRCATAILMRKQGVEARVTFWCPTCQPRTQTL